MQGEDGESPVVARGLLDGDAPAGPARPTREAALTVKFLTTHNGQTDTRHSSRAIVYADAETLLARAEGAPV